MAEDQLKYDLVVFDLDGTLIDTSEGIVKAANETLSIMGYERLDEENIMKMIGPPLANSLVNHGIIDENEIQSFNKTFRNLYETEYILKSELFNGIKELLMYLDGKVKMGVATNKPQKFTDLLLHHFNIIQYFDVVKGADLSGKTTKTDLINQCLDETNTNRKRALMVGDTDNDLIGANKSNVDFVGVTYGFGFKKGTIGMIDTPLELIEHLDI